MIERGPMAGDSRQELEVVVAGGCVSLIMRDNWKNQLIRVVFSIYNIHVVHSRHHRGAHPTSAKAYLLHVA